ncbi:MAG: immunoglobulin domain-containing protein [Planctomycetota bacterium]|jgi:hypothetical protein
MGYGIKYLIVGLAVMGLPASSLWAQPGYWVGIDLGAIDNNEGIIRSSVSDGDTVATTIGGLNCRRNLESGPDNYMYFNVDDNYAYQGDNQDLYVTIHYYDTGLGVFYLQYDSNTGSDTAAKYKNAGGVTITNTDKWKAWSWHITDAYFGNRQNGSSDFRIAQSNGFFYLDLVYVRMFCGGRSECVRMVPSPWVGGDGQQIRDLFENPDQWPISRAEIDILGTYHGPGGFQNVPDGELQQWMSLMADWGLMLALEVGALANWPGGCDGEHMFNILKPEIDRIHANGGRVDVFPIDEPLRKAMMGNCWGSGLSANYWPSIDQTVIWYGLVRQNYPDIQLCHIMPYRYHYASTIMNYIRDLNDSCAAAAVRGMDYFSIDCDWRVFSGEGGSEVKGNWNDVISIQNYCRDRGVPFSMIYNPSRASYSGSSNNYDFWNDIMRQASRYQSFGGQPDEFDLQSWLHNIPTSLPETQNYTLTETLIDLVAGYVPSHIVEEDDADFISSTIPDTMVTGEQRVVEVTMENTGALTWTAAEGYKLGAVGNSDPFAGTRHLLGQGVSVKRGQQHTFAFTMTAPGTTGTYLSDWQMIREQVRWFGDIHSKNIIVQDPPYDPPTITEHPQSQLFGRGSTVQLNVSATGQGTLGYQWYKDDGFLSNGGNISGTTSSLLQISNVQSADEGDYHCVVSNGGGSTPSNTATLTLAVVADFDLDNDVDQEDFGHLQECMSGEGIPQNDPACQNAKLDGDNDVDVDDFSILQGCMSGANIAVDQNCDN